MGTAQILGISIVIISHVHFIFLATGITGKRLASLSLLMFFSAWDSLPQSLSKPILPIPQILF